ncbi:hypothetical protein HFP15_08880 [Amycolatopsis sp. K13G38]|uniref:Excreted virulence factor EspC (Type VII ESX diderm) n=1 Tax=Amycolatopsis acididurans TaxID=2724524 RepID=A0ABX1IZN7_9PSEU|nr:hypothetical protein [Amycolatopsis acididurans]NKQ52993.1 hypothetical protein [Amycolatopsis acididurans]
MDFTVDVGGLDALGKNLDRTTENIDGATKRLADLGPDSIGPDDLDEACEDFRADWEEGLDKLREAVSEIRDGLDKAKQGYAEIENDLQGSLAKMAQAIGSAEVNS